MPVKVPAWHLQWADVCKATPAPSRLSPFNLASFPSLKSWCQYLIRSSVSLYSFERSVFLYLPLRYIYTKLLPAIWLWAIPGFRKIPGKGGLAVCKSHTCRYFAAKLRFLSRALRLCLGGIPSFRFISNWHRKKKKISVRFIYSVQTKYILVIFCIWSHYLLKKR